MEDNLKVEANVNSGLSGGNEDVVKNDLAAIEEQKEEKNAVKGGLNSDGQSQCDADDQNQG